MVYIMLMQYIYHIIVLSVLLFESPWARSCGEGGSGKPVQRVARLARYHVDLKRPASPREDMALALPPLAQGHHAMWCASATFLGIGTCLPDQPDIRDSMAGSRYGRTVTNAMQVPVGLATRGRPLVSGSARGIAGSMVVRRRSKYSGIINLILIQAREQLQLGLATEQARDREAVAGLEGTDRGLRLGGKQPIDRPRIIPEVAHMSFRDLDLSLAQNPVQRGTPRAPRDPGVGEGRARTIDSGAGGYAHEDGHPDGSQKAIPDDGEGIPRRRHACVLVTLRSPLFVAFEAFTHIEPSPLGCIRDSDIVPCGTTQQPGHQMLLP
jgi:hypothetical protein